MVSVLPTRTELSGLLLPPPQFSAPVPLIVRSL